MVFVGTFTADKGRTRKFIDEVEHRTYSGEYAARRGQEALFVTERCVFKLVIDGAMSGLELIEIAPGVDLERDILAQMDFKPAISADLKLMDSRIFGPLPMNWRVDFLAQPLEQRLVYDAQQELFFVNFEGFEVGDAASIERICELVSERLAPLGRKVPAVINYDNFSIAPDLMDEYVEAVDQLAERYYSKVTRYAHSTFMRASLGRAFRRIEKDAALFANSAEALLRLRQEE